MIGIVNYEVDIRGVEYKLREVDRSYDPANARCSSVWPNW